MNYSLVWAVHKWYHHPLWGRRDLQKGDVTTYQAHLVKWVTRGRETSFQDLRLRCILSTNWKNSSTRKKASKPPFLNSFLYSADPVYLAPCEKKSGKYFYKFQETNCDNSYNYTSIFKSKICKSDTIQKFDILCYKFFNISLNCILYYTL